jgi:SAM-dependent methyltransferase
VSVGFVLGLARGDERVVRPGARFTIADGIRLPVRDRSFDLVVSNHVLEHVGDREDQLQYLREARRVLREDGLLYLAVPNRYRLFEAHYDLPLLSWLPGAAADRYVRLLGRAEWYDVVAPSRRDLQALLRHSGFRVEDVTAAAARLAFGRLPGPLRLGAQVPDVLLRPALAVVPTIVVVCRPG